MTGQGHVYLRGKIWWIKFYQNGAPYYESSKSAKRTDAIKLLNKKLGEVQEGRHVPSSGYFVEELLNDLLQEYRLNRPRSYDDFAKPAVNIHLLPHWGKYRVTQVTTARLRAYQEMRKKQDAANATVNREMALLRRAFNLGFKSIPRKVAFVPDFPMMREDNVRTGFLDKAGYKKLLAELPDDLKPLLVVGYHVGCRKSEVLSMRWEQVDLENRLVRLFTGETKNDEGRTLPIYGEMLAVLRARKEYSAQWPDCKFVFHRRGEPIRDFRQTWDETCKRAGFPGLLFHDLRRSAVRNMIRAGVPQHVAMAISGHKTMSMFKRYDIIVSDDINEAGRKLEAYLGYGADEETRTPTPSQAPEPKSGASASSATSALAQSNTSSDNSVTYSKRRAKKAG